jgi:hypothetical protein
LPAIGCRPRPAPKTRRCRGRSWRVPMCLDRSASAVPRLDITDLLA